MIYYLDELLSPQMFNPSPSQISKQAVEYHHSLEIRKVEESRMRERIADLESKLADTQEKYLAEGLFVCLYSVWDVTLISV